MMFHRKLKIHGSPQIMSHTMPQNLKTGKIYSTSHTDHTVGFYDCCQTILRGPGRFQSRMS
jgi:hypothetical protein